VTGRLLLLAGVLAANLASAAPAPAPAPVTTPIPFKRDTGAASGITGSALGVLGVSLLAIGAVLVMRRRLRLDTPAGSSGKLLRVLESQRLGPRALLTVVEFDGTRYLVAQGEQGISCLAAAPVKVDA
jgi:flagellar biogenesis protein FliO